MLYVYISLLVDSPSAISNDDLLDSPDGLGPVASKRVAFEESSDMSDRSTVTSSEASPSSSFKVRKTLFKTKGKSKRRYSLLRRGKKNFEKGLYLINCQCQELLEATHCTFTFQNICLFT